MSARRENAEQLSEEARLEAAGYVNDEPSKSFKLRVDEKGAVRLPPEILARYHLAPGDELTLIEQPDAIVLLSPRDAVDRIADGIRLALEARGVTLAEMLDTLREIRDEQV